MKQYSHIVADSMCDYHIVGGSLADPTYGGIFHGQRIADNEWTEQTGTLGRARLGLPEQ